MRLQVILLKGFELEEKNQSRYRSWRKDQIEREQVQACLSPGLM
jgi:hypothetical protein